MENTMISFIIRNLNKTTRHIKNNIVVIFWIQTIVWHLENGIVNLINMAT